MVQERGLRVRSDTGCGVGLGFPQRGVGRERIRDGSGERAQGGE